MSKRPFTVYAWGKNDRGQLSQGSHNNILRPTPVKRLGSSELLSVTSGSSHSVAVDSKGRLFSAGCALHKKLGLSTSSTSTVPVFTQVTDVQEKRITEVACGDYHTLCLSEDGSVFTWGGGLHGKLGHTEYSIEVFALRNKEIVQVDCGIYHSVVRSRDGKVLSWGGGGSYNKGQCGQGHCKDIEQPSLIRFFDWKYVCAVSCGGYHTLALVAGNEVYAWGENELGQCGTGEFSNVYNPRLVGFPPRNSKSPEISQVSAGGYHSLALSADGLLYSFGYSAVGQLGFHIKTNLSKPTLVTSIARKPLRQVAAGWDHSLVLTERGDVFACGLGKFGQLGLDSCISITLFSHVKALSGKNVVNISAGGHHSWALIDPNQPEIDSYNPPSPLKLDIEVEGLFDPPFCIGVVYADVENCHRYAKFKLRENGEEALEEYVKDIYDTEDGTQFHKIESDSLLIISCPKIEPSGKRKTISDTMQEITLDDINKSPIQSSLCEWARYFLVKMDKFLLQPPTFFELRPNIYN